MESLPTTTRRLLALASAALIVGVGSFVVRSHTESTALQVAHSRFGTTAVVVPNAHRPVAAMVSSPQGLTPPSTDDPSVIATRFVIDNGDVLGLATSSNAPPTAPAALAPPSELTAGSTVAPSVDVPRVDAPRELRRGESLDGEWFRYEQTVSGVPVYGGDIVVALNGDGQVVSATVKSAAPAPAPPTFSLSTTDAQQIALDVATKRTGIAASELVTTEPQAVWFDPEVLADSASDVASAPGAGAPRSAYQVVVTGPPGVDIEVVVDANAGVPALVIDQVETIERRICDGANSPGSKLACTTANAVASPGSSTVPQVVTAYELAGVTADFFTNVLGRNSYDNLGSPLVATVRGCTTSSTSACPMRNAFWSGNQVIFGDGYATDDVLGHEFSHGVIQTTAGLMYYGQSGAINESIADVFGELIDRSTTIGGNDTSAQAWLLGEGVPNVGAFRNMADPPLRGQPDKMTSSSYRGTSWDNYGVHTNSGVLNKAAYLIDMGGTFNGYSMTGLGDAFTAKLLYQALTTTLVPGSDYADLAIALPQACQALVSANLASPSACQTVRSAVAATEMATPPTAPGATLSAATCDIGTAVSPNLFSDDAESGIGKWTTGSSVEGVTWWVSTAAATSGTNSLYGPDIDQPGDTLLTMANAVRLPAVNTSVGDKLFVRFDHTFSFESDTTGNFDGGVVEYELNGSGSWVDIKALATVNGYNAVLASPANPKNPLAGRDVFGAVSPGFQTTRVDLTSLAGNWIKLRFRIGSDDYVGDYGWYVDDVKVYQCATVAPTTIPATTIPATTAPATTIPATTIPATTIPATTVVVATAAPTTTAPTTTAPAVTIPTTVPLQIAISNGATATQSAQRGPSLQIN